MAEEPPPIPRIRSITGIFVETGIVMQTVLYFIPGALALPEWARSGSDPELGELLGAVAALSVLLFVGTLGVAHLAVGRAGSWPTRRWVAWQCLRYAIIGLACGFFMSVVFNSAWLEPAGILAVLLAVGLVALAVVGVGRLRLWRDRVYRERLLDRLSEGFVVVEGAVLDSRSSGRMTVMTTLGWRDAAGTARYARIIASSSWSELAPVSLIMRGDDQAKLVHASQQIG